MELAFDQRITTKLSLAVLLMDDFTKMEKIMGDVKVSIPSLGVEAISNPSGYYNFLDVPLGAHNIQVGSELYLGENVDVEMPYFVLGEPLRFDHAAGTALQRLEEEHVPCARLEVSASAEADFIKLQDIVGSINVGDVLMIEDNNSSKMEYCIVKAVPAGGGDGKYDLEYKLRRDHASDSSVKKMSPDPDPPVVEVGARGVLAGDIILSLDITAGEVRARDVFITDYANKEICLIAEPVLKVSLKPNCAYPFPSGTTMIKGVIKGADGKPLNSIFAEVVGGNKTTRTGKKGDFVIYFPPSEEDGVVDIKIKSTGSVPEKIVKADIRKGRTVSIQVEYP